MSKEDGCKLAHAFTNDLNEHRACWRSCRVTNTKTLPDSSRAYHARNCSSEGLKGVEYLIGCVVVANAIGVAVGQEDVKD